MWRHLYLLRKSDNYTVKFQDVNRTNALLKKAGIYDDIDAVLADSVCVLRFSSRKIIKPETTNKKIPNQASKLGISSQTK